MHRVTFLINATTEVVFGAKLADSAWYCEVVSAMPCFVPQGSDGFNLIFRHRARLQGHSQARKCHHLFSQLSRYFRAVTVYRNQVPRSDCVFRCSTRALISSTIAMSAPRPPELLSPARPSITIWFTQTFRKRTKRTSRLGTFKQRYGWRTLGALILCGVRV